VSTSAGKVNSGPRLSARAVGVDVSDDRLSLRLEDGRVLSAPLAWFPRLELATPEQRTNWRLIGRGIGIHWPDLDEDVSVENLLGADGDLLMYRAEPPDSAGPSTPGEPGPGRRRVPVSGTAWYDRPRGGQPTPE
jgi:hypothetical protein